MKSSDKDKSYMINTRNQINDLNTEIKIRSPGVQWLAF
jgi:hypothetical protein